MTRDTQPTGPARSTFFWIIALALSATLLLGFARSFYLYPLLGVKPLTLAGVIHGLIGTAWFALLVWQAWLGRSGRLADHRRWGSFGPWVAAAFVASALTIAVINALSEGVTGSGLPSSAGIFIQLGSTLWFAVLVSIGFMHRQRAALHKRAMVLATITMMAPAFSRISQLFRDGGPPLFDSSVFAAPFIFALAIYDWRSMGRLHPATLWAGGLYLVWTQIRMPLARSDAWTNFITPLLTGG